MFCYVLADEEEFTDLIIADPQLPDMEDWELLEYLHNSELYGKIPVIALSNLEKSRTQEKCNQLDIKQWFIKPFNPIELIQGVDKLISGIKSKEPALTIV